MVRALLDGRKTMTRRVVKPQPEENTDCPYHVGVAMERKARVCPYGQPGDTLWVRETWAREATDFSMPADDDILKEWPVFYRADGERDLSTLFHGKWNPSIHMCRWMSRLTLRLTDVRVERVQEISRDDCIAEGLHGYGIEHSTDCPKNDFRCLWDSINGKKYPWDSNPFVWAISFEKV